MWGWIASMVCFYIAFILFGWQVAGRSHDADSPRAALLINRLMTGFLLLAAVFWVIKWHFDEHSPREVLGPFIGLAVLGGAIVVGILVAVVRSIWLERRR